MRTDDGFTLIELLVTVAILGIVVVTLTGVVFGYLRTSMETKTRLSESNDQQFVSAYWQQDVSSLGMHDLPTGGDVPTGQSVWLGSPPSCAPTPAPGTAALVTFEWNDYQSVTSTDPSLAWSAAHQNWATYYTKGATNSNNTAQQQLWRKRCGDQTSDTLVAPHLTSVPVVRCYKADGSELKDGSGNPDCSGTVPSRLPVTVTITLAVRDKSETEHSNTGYTSLTLTGDRRQG